MKERIFLAFGGAQLHPELWPANQHIRLRGEWSLWMEESDRLSQYQDLMDGEKKFIVTVHPHLYPPFQGGPVLVAHREKQYRILLETVANYQRGTLKGAFAFLN
jgi:hypothetical protein